MSFPHIPVNHQIDVTDPLISEQPCRFVGPPLKAPKKQFVDLQEQGISRPLSSKWIEPFPLVAKSRSTWQIAGEYD